jgi:uncharacterized membrane protein YcaP (DUF421 family)
MLLQNPSDLIRVAVVGVLAYLTLILFLRVSGKRTLAKMNAFDLIVTVALGSILATTMLSSDVSLMEGLAAFIILIGLQFVIAWLSVKSSTVSGWVKSEPTLLFHQGQFLKQALRRERVTEDEVRAAVRNQGIATMAAVEAVILETDGSFSALPKTDQPATSLHGVRNIQN